MFDSRIVPVTVMTDAGQADGLARALLAAGLPVAEVTLRTAASLDAIAALARHDLRVGAGTVLSPRQVDQVAEAGAEFVVSPGLLPSVVQRCVERGLPCLPGVATPSELMQARELGINTVKFFPANVLGGVPALKALTAAFGGVGFVPTGGITQQNLAEYLALDCVVAVGGTWMVAPELLREGCFDRITELAAAAVRACQGEHR